MYDCPNCSKENIKELVHTYLVSAPFGPEVPFERKDYECSDCGHLLSLTYYSIIRDQENRKKKAFEESEKDSIAFMVNRLVEEHESAVAIERILGLDHGTFQAFRNYISPKNGKFFKIDRPKPELLALIRICCAFPWLINVVAKNFSLKSVDSKL